MTKKLLEHLKNKWTWVIIAIVIGVWIYTLPVVEITPV